MGRKAGIVWSQPGGEIPLLFPALPGRERSAGEGVLIPREARAKRCSASGTASRVPKRREGGLDAPGWPALLRAPPALLQREKNPQDPRRMGPGEDFRVSVVLETSYELRQRLPEHLDPCPVGQLCCGEIF